MSLKDRVEIPEPQLARLAEVPPSGPEWVHEIKFDGYRTLCRIEGKTIWLFTRNGLDWTEKYESLLAPLKRLKTKDAIIDGEIVALDEKGRSSFQALQSALKSPKRSELVFFAFDLLRLNGRDLIEEPLLERKKLLKKLIASARTDSLRYSEHWGGDGKGVLKASCGLQLEGIISKRVDLPYESGRGAGWIKSKCTHGQEFVVGGYTLPKGSRTGFGALLLGVNEKGKLRYVGRVGTGFDTKLLLDIKAKLKTLEISDSPFDLASPKGREIRWVKPKLVANVEFTEWTEDGVLRHPTFQGLRQDKAPKDVVVEKPKRAAKPDGKKDSEIEGIALSNPGRVLFPKAGHTKLDVARYYQAIAPWILPHAKNRPLSLFRCPEGEGGECFFQKHMDHGGQGGLKSREINSKFKGEREEILYVDDVSGLVELTQMGALELHAWGCHRQNFDKPDLLVFDFDPDEAVDFEAVVEASFTLKDKLDRLDLESFVKTTGGKGLHVHVPVMPTQDWGQVKGFAKALVSILEKEEPSLYTTELSKAKRRGKIFLDYLRNGYGATAILPYSLRAKPAAPVALPVTWRELEKLDGADGFTMKEVEKKLKRARDPWKGYFETRQKLPKLK